MKTATVKEIQSVRPWQGQHGTVYFHKIVMDNGDIGEIGKKSDNALKPGDSLTYEIEQSQYGNKFKESKPMRNGFGMAAPASKSAMALAYAKDIIVAQINAGKTADLKTNDLVDATMKVAEKFHNWVKEHE